VGQVTIEKLNNEEDTDQIETDEGEEQPDP